VAPRSAPKQHALLASAIAPQVPEKQFSNPPKVSAIALTTSLPASQLRSAKAVLAASALGKKNAALAAAAVSASVLANLDDDSAGDTSSGLADSGTDPESASTLYDTLAAVGKPPAAAAPAMEQVPQAPFARTKDVRAGAAADGIGRQGIAAFHRSSTRRSNSNSSSSGSSSSSSSSSGTEKSDDAGTLSRLDSIASGPVRAFIAGGGRAVRKLAQRIRNNVVNIVSSPESKSRGSGLGSGSNDDDLVPTSDDDETASQRCKRFLAPVAVTAGGVVFRDEGVGGWIDPQTEVSPGPLQHPSVNKAGGIQRPALQKRARARDAGDADYDRGKAKKVKHARPGAGVGMRLHGHGAAAPNRAPLL
jgi:hypothetical protein